MDFGCYDGTCLALELFTYAQAVPPTRANTDVHQNRQKNLNPTYKAEPNRLKMDAPKIDAKRGRMASTSRGMLGAEHHSQAPPVQ